MRLGGLRSLWMDVLTDPRLPQVYMQVQGENWMSARTWDRIISANQ